MVSGLGSAGLREEGIEFPVPVVCPLCLRGMAKRADDIECPPCDRADCPRAFRVVGGFPDLIVGYRFEDDKDEAFTRNEETSSAHTAYAYWAPLLRRLLSRRDPPPRILALGCGVGMEVDVLRREGFECVGIDCGNRAKVWPRRESPHALLMANGMHLPFPDETFDAAFCGCVFPHVGVVGDSFKVAPDFRESRLSVAREMVRVLKPGGHAVVSSPNRLFPFDIFHGRKLGSYKPRLNPPTSRFLLSFADYRDLFLAAGCLGVRTEPVRGYWGFCRTKNTIAGWILGLPVRSLFTLGSVPWAPFLRSSPLLPWIVVRATK